MCFSLLAQRAFPETLWSTFRRSLRSTKPSLQNGSANSTRAALHMPRQVFALRIGVNPRTLERWEQGRSKPNEQASTLIRLVRKYPDTLERLESLSVPA